MRRVLGLIVALLTGPALYELYTPVAEPLIGRFFAPPESECIRLVGLLSCLFIVNLAVQLFLTLVWKLRSKAVALAMAFYLTH